MYWSQNSGALPEKTFEDTRNEFQTRISDFFQTVKLMLSSSIKNFYSESLLGPK